MAKKRWEQIAAVSGILFLVLQFSAQGLIQVGGAEPSFNASAEEILDFFLNRDPQLFNIGGILSVFSFIAFLLFLGVLWARLHSSEEKPAWMSMIAFGSGLLSGAIIMGIGGAGGWALAIFRIEESLSINRNLVNVITLQIQRAERLRQSILKWAFEGKLVAQEPDDEPASALLERIRAEAARVKS